jgi:hypothetical protein
MVSVICKNVGFFLLLCRSQGCIYLGLFGLKVGGVVRLCILHLLIVVGGDVFRLFCSNVCVVV